MDTKVHVEHGDSTAAVPVADPHPNFKQGLREASILAPSPALAMTTSQEAQECVLPACDLLRLIECSTCP